MVNDALQRWCDNVVHIGEIFAKGGDVVAAAKQQIADTYDYDQGKVLFKPTLAFGRNTFRPTKEGALAYFVGQNADFPEDKGFKLKPWVRVWYNKLDYVLHGDLAIVQCNVHLIGADDSHIFVNKSFVFKICDDGKTRIVLHQRSPGSPTALHSGFLSFGPRSGGPVRARAAHGSAPVRCRHTPRHESHDGRALPCGSPRRGGDFAFVDESETRRGCAHRQPGPMLCAPEDWPWAPQKRIIACERRPALAIGAGNGRAHPSGRELGHTRA
ncbi:MAG: hypothetical protein U0183_07215 [Polyangiaceae bacterium]